MVLFLENFQKEKTWKGWGRKSLELCWRSWTLVRVCWRSQTNCQKRWRSYWLVGLAKNQVENTSALFTWMRFLKNVLKWHHQWLHQGLKQWSSTLISYHVDNHEIIKKSMGIFFCVWSSKEKKRSLASKRFNEKKLFVTGDFRLFQNGPKSLSKCF